MSTMTELQATVTGILDGELPEATTKLYHGIPVWCVGDEPTIGIKLTSAADLDEEALRGWVRAAKAMDS